MSSDFDLPMNINAVYLDHAMQLWVNMASKRPPCTLIWPPVPLNPPPCLTITAAVTQMWYRYGIRMNLTVIIERDSLVIIDGFQLVSGPKLSPIDDTGWIAVRWLTVQCQRIADDWPMNLGCSDWWKWFLYYSITIIKTMHTVQQY